MSQVTAQTCPVCGVRIEAAASGDRVYFSYGPPGTRAKLWSRVCQYAQKPACINGDREAVGPISSSDGYDANPNLSLG
jgi:hypothetical protein